MDSCAWVTQALEEENVEKAIVLGNSLRRVLTRKSLVVVVHPAISLESRYALESTFDLVLPLDEGKCGVFQDSKMAADTIAKYFTLSLTFLEKCVFLPPASLALKNCDHVFEENVGNKGKEDGQVVMLKPSRELFRKTNEFLAIRNNNNKTIGNQELDADRIMMELMRNQPTRYIQYLPEPYSVVVTLKDKSLIRNNDELAICVLVDLPANVEKLNPTKNGFSSAGLMQKYVYQYWLDIYAKTLRRSEANDTQDLILPRIEDGPMKQRREPVAVVGMSCRYPSSNNLSEFWGLLIEGRDGIRTPPEFRWTKEQSVVHKAETRQTQAGFLNVPVDEFDAKFFGISPKEMIFIDPQHRILHELVWEALEDAGINPLELSGEQAGVFMGSWRNDYYDILQRSASREFYRGYMGNSIGAGAARISHLLGLTGPCVATESGCSAAMVAVHMAIRSLQNGESSMAFACGVNMLLHPFTTNIMPMVTAPDGHCKSFDAKADGFGRAEGAGVLILKRLSEAVKDGDSIWGVIKGSAIAQEGVSKSMGTPTVHCESQAMRTALQDADVHPSEVSYVETHGTGTIVGDPMEVAAIGQVYSEGRTDPLVIGSVKTNVGHTESCSGITGIMKVILSMKNEVIPPHRNFSELNPNVNLDVIPARLPLEPVPWPKVEGKPRVAGISSFGITGTDGHVVLEEPLDYSNQKVVFPGIDRPLHLMTISARTEEALDVLIDKYKAALSNDNIDDITFANMAHTTNAGRAHFNYRVAVIASNAKDAAAQLNSNKLLRGEVTGEENTGKTCFLFTGQGSQYPGMGKELYNTNAVFRMNFDHCEKILKRKLNISIADTFWSDSQEENSFVNRTLYSQTGIFVVEYCLMKLWESWGVKPDFVLGHSLGEFCAAVCGGILTFEEAITLVAERSRLIDALPEGKMLVVKADKNTVDNYIKKFVAEKRDTVFWLDYAAINSSDQTVLAGDSENVTNFAEWLKSKEVKCAVLQSSHAFHSRHMDPMLEEYRTVAEKIFKNKTEIEPNCQYVSGMLGKIVDPKEYSSWPEYWVQHTREKVSFLQASKTVFNEAGCRLFLEIGPSPVLTAFMMMNNEGKFTCLPSLRKNETNWTTLLHSLSKVHITGTANINWKRFDQFYNRKKVGQLLPSYPFMGTKYWPNITSSSGSQIHPLLGSSIPNPTNSKLYQNSLCLQNVEYLKDHVIGTMVVFPGAGYLETLLTAGHVTIDGASGELRFPRRPIQLENFRIEAPLRLEEGNGCTWQTVVEHNVSTDDNSTNGLFIKIFHEAKDGEEGTSKWISHASGTFTPYNPGSGHTEQIAIEDPSFYKEAIERLRSTGKTDDSLRDFYEKVADVGLHFGPAFRTISNLWRGGENQCELLTEVLLPKDLTGYLVHPCLIDAMIQASIFYLDKNKKLGKKLRVPMGCERFIWLKPMSSGEPKTEETSEEEPEVQDICYIYTHEQSKTIILLDKEGNPCAAMVNVDTIETNAKSIQAMLETQVRSMPDLFKVQFKSTLGPMQNRLDWSLVSDLCDVIDEEVTDRSDISDSNIRNRRDIDTLVSLYAVNAFLNLGWKPVQNETLIVDDFVKSLGIKPQHKKLIRQFFVILEQEGIMEETGNTWVVRYLPDSSEKITESINEIYQRSSVSDVADQVLLLHNIGTKLDKILTGTESALRILFPDDESKPSATKFYDNIGYKTNSMLYSAWYKVWENCRNTCTEKGLPIPTVRLLEVGAGTGTVTEIIIQSLEANGIDYEYHYTDISAAFFPAAEKRFDKYRKRMVFKKLNLEQDPTIQGFPPNYYDYVVGAHVVHATRDIKESMLNLYQVMRHEGNLILYEFVSPKRVIDCIFGLLEGFWRFTDFELRPHHAVIEEDKWDLVGKTSGFPKFSYCHDFEMGVLGFKVDKEETEYSTLSKSMNMSMQQIQKEAQTGWLLFYTEGEETYVAELIKKFENVGRKVVVKVKHSDVKMVESASLDFTIRPHEKEDMDSVFAALGQSAKDIGTLEGILITWGLYGNQGTDQTKMALPYLNMIQNVLKLDKKNLPQVVVLTSGQYGVGDILCENPTSSTLIGMTRCIANEHAELRVRGIDIDPCEIDTSIDQIFQEIFTGFNEHVAHFCAFRGTERFVPRLVPEKAASKGGSLPLPSSTDRFQLIHPKSKSIQDLEFGDLPTFTLNQNEIEVKVKCSALNFKDILNILKPIPEFKDSNGVGFDFAGVVTAVGEKVTERKVGDPVFGINIMGNALPSHIKLPEDAVAPVPDSCTFTEAACFPAVFSTAYYCLVNVAHCKPGEYLLMHTASGGVGLLAIQLANHFGLNVICTAGSHRKRSYLRSLGVQHVFHSRNTNYGKEILEVTGGRGVDIVLNSLTGPGFKEATLEACAKGARFVEMSKLNIWTEEEVAAMRPDVEYTIIDLTKLDEESSRKLLKESRQLIDNGVVKPIPYTRYDAQNIRDALGYLQKAQHIGKVVVTMPDTKPGQLELNSLYTPMFSERSTYLVTGGLGGIGMEVCKYLLSNGAKHVVLVGRSAPTTATQAVIQNLNENGSNVVVIQADVGNWDDCVKMFDQMKSMGLPTLRGIMHCAGTIADAVIENLSWKDFQATYQAKVSGSWNLHNLTKSTILEHFVLFSSVTAPFGSPGQATHVSACTFEDTFAHYRNSKGLPATTINWGQFGQIGCAAEADVLSIRPFSPQQGINALDFIIRHNKNHLIVAALEKALAAVLKFLPYTKKVIDEQVLKQVGDSNNTAKKKLDITTTQFWEDYNDCKDDRDGKLEIVKKYCKIMLRHVLRLDTDEPIDDNTDLQDMGVDSLMMLELKNHLQEVLGDRIQITQSAMKDCSSVFLLSDRLVQIIEEEGEFGKVEPPTLEETRDLVLRDCQLPEHIQASAPGSEKKASEIKVVLMTGATGSLGSHLLREMLEECPQLEKVYCLVRARGGESAQERLNSILERKCIMGSMKNYSKVTAIAGNVIEEKFGLSDEDYNHLSKEVDAVINCGAKVNHVEYYRNVSGGRSDARTVNVLGLHKILEFCASGQRTKHLINTSALISEEKVDPIDDTISESWPEAKNVVVTHNRGYLMSKYVGDILVGQACERGIPCKSFRYPELRSSRIAGGSQLEQSHYMRTLLYFMKIGIMFDTPLAANFMHVDLASKITCRVMFNDSAPDQVYNVSHPQPQLIQEYFPRLAQEMGHPVALVDVDEYRNRVLENSEGEDDKKDQGMQILLTEFKDLYKDEDALNRILSGGSEVATKYFENVENFWRSKRLVELVPDLYREEIIESSYEITKRDFLKGKAEGLFDKLGL